MTRKKKGSNNRSMAPSDAGVNQFDLWLQRSSYISQAVLTIVTLASMYFVVLPIYQKEVLAEAIAKKELELSSIQAQVDELYLSNKHVRLGILLQGLSIRCSILHTSMDDKTMRERLEFDVADCWQNDLDEFLAQKILRAGDIPAISDAFNQSLKIIETERQKTITEYENFKEVPPDFKLPEDSAFHLLPKLDIHSNILPAQMIKDRENALFERARNQIAYNYFAFINQEVRKLQDRLGRP